MKTYPIWLLVIAISAVSATRYGRFTGKSVFGETPMDMSLDTDHMIIIPGTPKPLLPNFIHTISYHDYITGFVAHKHVDGNACYIMKTNATYTRAKAILDDIVQGEDKYAHQEVVDTVRSRNPLLNVGETAGLQIAEFCQGYSPFFLTVKEKGEKRDQTLAQFAQVECGDQLVNLRSEVRADLLEQGGFINEAVTQQFF